MERQKLELELNKPAHLKMLFDQPKIGESQYGKYFLYAVRNGDGNEYSFFAPEEVHNKLKELKQGDEAVVTKLAAQKGKKVVTTYDVQIVGDSEVDSSGNSAMPNPTNPYLEAMYQSFEDAIKIQEKFNGMANVNQLAVTMFIQRVKVKGL